MNSKLPYVGLSESSRSRHLDTVSAVVFIVDVNTLIRGNYKPYRYISVLHIYSITEIWAKGFLITKRT